MRHSVYPKSWRASVGTASSSASPLVAFAATAAQAFTIERSSLPRRRAARVAPAKSLAADALDHACPMDLAERVERLGFNVFRQLLRPPSLANLAFGAVAVALGKQDPRERKPAFAARRLAAREATHRRGVAPLLPRSPFRAPAQQADARPARVVGNECRVPAETRFTGRVAQDQPFDELLGHRIADRFFDAGCFASFALAHQIDRLLDRLHQLRRSCGCGGRWSLSDRRWLRKCRILRGHLTGRGGALLSCNVDVRRRLRLRDGNQPAQRRSPGPDHFLCFVTLGLPGKRGADTDQSRNGKASKAAEYSPANRRPVARELIVLEAGGARRHVH